MAMGASTGCNSVYGSTPPNNPAPVSVDEQPVPGRRHHLVDHGRELHPGSLPSIRHPGTTGLIACSSATRTSCPYQDYFDMVQHDRRDHDGPGNPRAAQGLGGGRRRRPGRHRLPERLQGHASEPAQRAGDDARHAGVLQHRRPELRLLAAARRVRHEPVRRSHRGQAHGDEERRGNPHRGTRFALRRTGVDGPTRPSSTRRCSTASNTAAPPSTSASPPARPSTATADDVSTLQAQRIRDSRGLPEFTFDSRKSEIYHEVHRPQGQPAA